MRLFLDTSNREETLRLCIGGLLTHKSENSLPDRHKILLCTFKTGVIDTSRLLQLPYVKSSSGESVEEISSCVDEVLLLRCAHPLGGPLPLGALTVDPQPKATTPSEMQHQKVESLAVIQSCFTAKTTKSCVRGIHSILFDHRSFAALKKASSVSERLSATSALRIRQKISETWIFKSSHDKR